MKLSEIALLCELDAPPADKEITGINAFTQAQAGELTYLANPDMLPELALCQASVILWPQNIEAPNDHQALIWPVKHPHLAMALISNCFKTELFSDQGSLVVMGHDVRCHESVVLGRDVRIGDRVILHPGVVVGDRVCIGDDSIVYPNVTIYQDVTMGARCIIHAGCVIGGDGFGFVKDAKGRQVKFHQTGKVVLGDDVEIGSNSTIDRATFGATVVGNGSKIDNLVQIGHNSVLGEQVICCSQSGIAGSVKVGSHVIVGPQAGSAGHLSIGDQVVLAARAGVTKSIAKPGVYSGFPAEPHRKAMRIQAWIRRMANKS